MRESTTEHDEMLDPELIEDDDWLDDDDDCFDDGPYDDRDARQIAEDRGDELFHEMRNEGWI